jgi:hypothetical protein
MAPVPVLDGGGFSRTFPGFGFYKLLGYLIGYVV